MSLKFSRSFLLPAVAMAALTTSHAAQAVDWAKIEPKKIMLMYPATSSFEHLQTRGRHSGSRRYPEKSCASCHAGSDEHPLGDSLVHAEKIKEPAPIAGKPGAIDTQVKTAHDANNLYVRIEFDPGEQPDAGMDKDFETKVAMMMDDGNVNEANKAGCWVACHADVASMSRGVEGTTKYLWESLVPGGGAAIKSEADLATMRTEGKYLEYWQARLNPGAKAVAVDGTVLEKRTDNATPAVKADATRTKAGVWTVTFTRKLKGVPGHKDIVPGKTYTIGFAIHAGHTAKRFHYVSFERTLVLDDGKADFVAAVK